MSLGIGSWEFEWMEIGETVYLVDDVWDSRRAVAARVASCGAEPWPFPNVEAFAAVAAALKPAPLLIALSMPRALDLMEGLLDGGARFPVIGIARGCDVASAVAAMKQGAIDVLDSDVGAEQVGGALREARSRIAQDEEAQTACALARRRVARLTAREREVVRGLLAGKRNKIIAHELGISTRTVEMHRAHLLEKLGAGNLAHAAVMLSTAGELREAG
jgi:two-component system response regulator FixJ